MVRVSGYHLGMNFDGPDGQLYFTTLHLTCRTPDGGSWTATGFNYGVETDEGRADFLITNRHVLEGVQEITFRGVAGKDGSPVLGSAVTVTLVGEGGSGLSWNGHPDPVVDVAALPLVEVFDATVGSAPFFLRGIPPKHCLTEQRAAALNPLEEVLFAGYPFGIYDSVNVLPVVRRGITASPIGVDYEGQPAFLIDASVFPGSSGSPVFMLDNGYDSSAVMAIAPRKALLCLGVLAAVHTGPLSGKLVPLPTADLPGVVVDQPIGLGIVYRAAVFDACVDPMLAAQGLTRAN